MNINLLIESFETLKEAHEQYRLNKDNAMQKIIADSCVKRFEYTLETAIKTMKKFLKERYNREEKDLTTNNVFRLMNGYGFIESWMKWRDYYQKRNTTVHEYNSLKSQELITLIPSFISDVSMLIEQLQNSLSQESYFKIARDILQNHMNEFDFFVYGSRVKGTFQSSSDMDILIKGEQAISTELLNKIKSNFDNSDLPFIVNFCDFYDIDKDFYDSIYNDLFNLNAN